jgi:hypothetical protein
MKIGVIISTNDDTERVSFIVEHLKAVAQAMYEY